MATNIPPHNLREVVKAVVKIIDNRIEEGRETEIEEILDIVKGPDFPTGAMILGTRGIQEAYRTGRGKIRVRAVTEIESMPNGKSRILVSELPYMVNKARLIEKWQNWYVIKRLTESQRSQMNQAVKVCVSTLSFEEMSTQMSY